MYSYDRILPITVYKDGTWEEDEVIPVTSYFDEVTEEMDLLSKQLGEAVDNNHLGDIEDIIRGIEDLKEWTTTLKRIYKIYE